MVSYGQREIASPSAHSATPSTALRATAYSGQAFVRSGLKALFARNDIMVASL